MKDAIRNRFMIWIMILCVTPLNLASVLLQISEAACSGSGISWTCPAGTSDTDVQAANDNATSGYTIQLALGAYSWSTGVLITKAGTIQGIHTPDLISSTATTCNPAVETCITYTGASANAAFGLAPASNITVNVSNVYVLLGSFNNGRRLASVYNTNAGFPLDHIRFHHTTAQGGGGNSACFHIDGWIESLWDHNRVEDCMDPFVVFDFQGAQGLTSWTRMYTSGVANTIGTSHCNFIEDNKIVHTNAGGTNVDADVYTSYGGCYVFRYNNVDGSTFSSENFYIPLGVHGNFNGYCDASGGTCYRSTVTTEVHNNTFKMYKAFQIDTPRGGSHVWHDNTITYVNPPPTQYIGFVEEEMQTGLFTPTRTTWPSQDGIINSFYWNNSVNGVLQDSTGLADFSQTSIYTLERDYYAHAPEATGGKCTYVGRAGASGNAPSASDGGSVSCSGSGANAYYPYTPYTYPHPLQGEGDRIKRFAQPAPPRNLHLMGLDYDALWLVHQ